MNTGLNIQPHFYRETILSNRGMLWLIITYRVELGTLVLTAEFEDISF